MSAEPSSAEAEPTPVPPRSGGLAEQLDRPTTVGQLWRPEGSKVRCFACAHRCLIPEGARGVCKVRFNADGQLRVPFGYVTGLACDPIEKKPFFHVYPGSDALTFGMLGCDFHCGYCQNWLTSQALRDPDADVRFSATTPEQIVAVARRYGAPTIVSSYNEPLITAEWAAAVFAPAQEAGLLCGFVSNGNATSEALDFLKPWLSLYKIDLKCFDDRHYRGLGGTLRAVTDTIRMVVERGLWLEVVTLVVPGFNDSEAELRQIAGFLASASRDIPWHVNAFHQDYRMTEPANTSAAQLIRAAEIGVEASLRFVYAGNLPGRLGRWENTYCPSCGDLLVERVGFKVRQLRITAEGRCPACAAIIPGRWNHRASADFAGEPAHLPEARHFH